jgi:L-iditol 2-dehydrogenase
MRQFVMTAPGKIETRELPIPELKSDQVLLRIHRIGICGSDIHVFHGKHPYTSYPVVQGHEVSGEVVGVGISVKDIAVGQRATFMPQMTCGTCYPCTHGQYHICDNLKVMGFQTTGAASDYFILPARNVIVLPDGVDYDMGAMIEPIAVAVHAVRRLGSVEGKMILVLGAGPIGNLVAQTAKGLGASKVMITDVSDFRLSLAEQCGIDFCINTLKEDLSEAISRDFGPEKADGILECVGLELTMDQAIRNARKGTDIIVVGVFGDKGKVDMGLVQDREIRLIGTLMYQESDYHGALQLLTEKKIQLSKLISQHFPASKYPEAYTFIEHERDKSMKIMIDFMDDKAGNDD